MQSFTAQKRLVRRGGEAASVLLLAIARIKLRQVFTRDSRQAELALFAVGAADLDLNVATFGPRR